MGRRSGREKAKIREAKQKLVEEMTPGWIIADARLKEALEELRQKRLADAAEKKAATEGSISSAIQSAEDLLYQIRCLKKEIKNEMTTQDILFHMRMYRQKRDALFW
jgi:hypothetical protein